MVCLFWTLSAGLLGGYRFLSHWSFFSIEDLTVQGNDVLSREEILRTARLSLGLNCLDVSIANVQHRLIDHPWIKMVRVRRILPDKLYIFIEEKEPFFWIKCNNAIYYADKQGTSIAPVTAGRFLLRPFLRWEGDMQQREVMDTFLEMVTRKDSFLTLEELAWIHFVQGGLFTLFVQDWEIEITMESQNIRSNWSFLQNLWYDLLKRKELNHVSHIRIYEQMGWAQLLPPAS
jgi:cell division protein FtsQ